MTTRLYLDIDGVLNAFDSCEDRETLSGWSDWTTTPVQFEERGIAYPITHSSEMIAAFNELTARDDVDPRWLTTWRDSARTQMSPAIGINGHNWTVVHEERPPYGIGWWKYDAFQDDMSDPDQRAIWIDDDHTIYSVQSTIPWASQYAHRTLVISPDPRTGVKRADFDTMNEFLSRS